MSGPRDVEALRASLKALTRVLALIDKHALDLYYLGWEPKVAGAEKVKTSDVDTAPRSGNDRARRLYTRIAAEADRAEKDFVGLTRAMATMFVGGAPRPEPTRGSLHSSAEHDRLVAKQRQRAAAGDYVPARLENQPHHPGRKK